MSTPGHLQPPAPALRVCLGGEQLDWLGGYSICLAVDATNGVRYEGDHRTNVQVGDLVGKGLASSSALLIAEHVGSTSSQLSNSWLADVFHREFATDRGGGMDHLAITLGGLVLTDGVDGDLPRVVARREPHHLVAIVIDPNQPKHSGAVVGSFRRRLAEGDALLGRYAAEVSPLVWQLWNLLGPTCLLTDDVHGLINQCHEAMRDYLGVVTAEQEELRTTLLRTGPLRSLKVCGSGGGGVLVTLASVDEADELCAELAFQLERRGRSEVPSVFALAAACDGVKW